MSRLRVLTSRMSMDGEQARARLEEQRAEAQRLLGQADREAVDDDRLETDPAAEPTVEDADQS